MRHELPIEFSSMEGLFNIFGDLYEILWNTAFLIWEWLNQPLDPELVELLPIAEMADTYLELVISGGLIMVLIFAVIKFFTPLM